MDTSLLGPNNSSKINPKVIESWAEVLKRVPSSRLYIKNRGYMHKPTRDFVLKVFADLGVEESRITVVSHAKTVADHLDHYHEVDIALDTFPYNGTTTTVEAFYMGVPVIACYGDRHAARVSASLLKQVNLEDWVADDIDNYIELAVLKASHPNNLAKLRQGMRQRLMESSICDYSTFARKMESAFRDMWIEWSAKHGAKQEAIDSAVEANAADKTKIRARALAREGMHAQQRGDSEEAISHFQEALSLEPYDSYANGQLADLLHRNGMRSEALPHYELMLKSSKVQALQWANYGSCLQEMGRFEESVKAFENGLAMNDAMPGVHMNLGASLRSLYQYGDALKHFEKAIELYPEFAEAYDNLGGLLKEIGQFDDAVACYCKALDLKPGDPITLSNLLLCLQYVPGIDDASLRSQHQLWEQYHGGHAFSPADFPHLKQAREKLRIAYLSADFKCHSVYWFIRGILKAHQRERFEIWAFSDVAMPDAYTEEASKHVDVWVDSHALNHEELLKQIRDSEIDVLIDLSGHTAGNRMPVLSARAAPLQCSWLGYPYHPGSSAVDYLIADDIMVGASDFPTLNLAGGYHSFSPDMEKFPTTEFEESGKPVLLSCNTFSKLNDLVLQSWAKILEGVPNAILAVKCKQFASEGMQQDFKERCEKAGIPVARLELHAWSSEYGEHLNLYKKASLLLDSFPYNGTTTTAEALWMGVPVVSCSMDTPASRVGKSLLTQVGHPEWVSADIDGYIAKAISMAKDSGMRKACADSLRSVCVSSSLGQADKLVGELEASLLQAWESRVCALQPSTMAETSG